MQLNCVVSYRSFSQVSVTQAHASASLSVTVIAASVGTRPLKASERGHLTKCEANDDIFGDVCDYGGFEVEVVDVHLCYIEFHF